jgi:hypothetical protein
MSIIQHISDALNVPVVPYNEWLARLEASPATDEALHRNPALHLVGFYRVSAPPSDEKGIQDREAMGMAMYETKKTVSDAPSLRPQTLPQLGKYDVNLWIGYWRSKGVLDL